MSTPGRRLGRYHLLEPLGGGPNGEVYRAKVMGVAGMEKELAIKRFFPSVVQVPGVASKLSQAARTYGSLAHPRIARLAELGVAGGETFTATELVVGIDLARVLAMSLDAGASLPTGAALGMVSAAARAIGYAHGRGVLHLGLSPTNVIATTDGDVTITDVGILGCRLPLRPASDPSLLGRLGYLAPEQLQGDPVTASTDVYALGVIACELVTGRPLVSGTNGLELEQAILALGLPALGLTPEVAGVIGRCLARSSSARFPDARALADALDAALRVAALPGDRQAIGALVSAGLAQVTSTNEQQLSGALRLAIPSPAGRLPLQPPNRTLPRGISAVGTVPPPANNVTVLPSARPRRASSSPVPAAEPAPGAVNEIAARRRPRMRAGLALAGVGIALAIGFGIVLRGASRRASNVSADARVAIAAGRLTDAGRPTPQVIDAGRPDVPVAPDKLVIDSSPAGARVFLDGAEQGRTPATVAASSDRLGLAIALAGYELYLQEIPGRGRHHANLVPAVSLLHREGGGSIRVRCKTLGRYYVFIDRHGTGQLCANQRFSVATGAHLVEIYDLVSEARRQFRVAVRQVNRPTVVKVD